MPWLCSHSCPTLMRSPRIAKPTSIRNKLFMLQRLARSIFVLALLTCIAPRAGAIPAFARMYGTSCTTCHLDFPKLNDFGRAFKGAGLQFPKDDESFIKIPPVLLGAPANKEAFPHAVWPGTIPGIPPIGLRYNHFFQVVSDNRNNFNLQQPTDPTMQQFIPRTDFQTGLFSIFTAGN